MYIYFFSKIVMTFHCLNEFVLWPENFITRTNFSHGKSKLVLKQNTIDSGLTEIVRTGNGNMN